MASLGFSNLLISSSITAEIIRHFAFLDFAKSSTLELYIFPVEAEFSSTLHTYKIGFKVSNCKDLIII